MSWARLDDQLPQSAKWGSLSGDAFRLGIVALCWAREDRNLRKRPGFIPAGMISGMARRPQRGAGSLVRELVEAGKPMYEEGIWLPTDAGWSFHDFQQYAPPLPRKKWSTEYYALVRSRDGDACRYCGSTDRPTIDHVYPRVLGGEDHPDNLVVACRRCNCRKGGRTHEQAGMVLQ